MRLALLLLACTLAHAQSAQQVTAQSPSHLNAPQPATDKLQQEEPWQRNIGPQIVCAALTGRPSTFQMIPGLGRSWTLKLDILPPTPSRKETPSELLKNCASTDAVILTDAQNSSTVTALMDAPQPKVTRADLALLAADAGVRMADAGLTRWNVTHGGAELLLPRFVYRSTPRMVAYSGAVVLADWLVYRRLKRRHPKLARAFILVEIGQDGACVGWSARGIR